MNVLFVASECAPLAKVGGLADVVGSLPKALKSLGVDARIALPKYDVIHDAQFPSQPLSTLTVPFNGKEQTITIRETHLPESEAPVYPHTNPVYGHEYNRVQSATTAAPSSDEDSQTVVGIGVGVYLLDHSQYFGNGGVYVEADASSGGSRLELNRFGLFARAIPELIQKLGWQPDLIHCHDWQTGALPAILAAGKQETKKTKKQMRTLFTIHNLAYQGIHPRADIEHAFGNEIASTLAPHPHNPNEINFLASALTTADRISTVSPTYAQEITTTEFGNGLEHLLNRLSPPPVGILNGIDTGYWNPAADRFLAERYGTPEEAAHAQPLLKQTLQSQLSLPMRPASPLLVMVSRLTEQKGFDILIPAIRTLLPAHEFQAIILATGDKRYAKELQELAEQFPRKLRFVERFDEPLAHLLYAAGDFFLMPSRFEPCGLGQMIAMRYGSIPIATAVGGLKDTVRDAETGFVVPSYTTDALITVLQRALNTFRAHPDAFAQLRANGMAQDFSWTHSAKKYLELYQNIIE